MVAQSDCEPIIIPTKGDAATVITKLLWNGGGDLEKPTILAKEWLLAKS
jgi:hypothetical protein